MTLKNFIIRTGVILFVLLSLQLSAPWACGWCMTTNETGPYIKIQTDQWNALKTEFNLLNQELIECQKDLQKLKKPSTELVQELNTAQNLLEKLQAELDQQKQDLTLLSSEADGLRTSLATLKEQINKERKTHRRQIWQNRFWCILIGAGIGMAIKG